MRPAQTGTAVTAVVPTGAFPHIDKVTTGIRPLD